MMYDVRAETKGWPNKLTQSFWLNSAIRITFRGYMYSIGLGYICLRKYCEFIGYYIHRPVETRLFDNLESCGSMLSY